MFKLTKPGFRISTKIQLHYHFKTSAAKYWTNSCFKSCLNFNFKIMTRPFAQSLNKSLILWPNLRFHICNKLLPTRSSSSTSATIKTSTSFELASSKARVTSIKFTKRESVSQLVSDKSKQWSNSGLIKRIILVKGSPFDKFNKSAVTKFEFGLLEEQLPCYSNTKYPFIFYPFWNWQTLLSSSEWNVCY